MPLTSLITSRNFTINWNPPGYNDQNGVITYYNVSLVEVETGSIFYYTFYTTTLTIQSLYPAYTYQYRIAAYTIGLGPYSDPNNITTAEEGKPLCLLNVITVLSIVPSQAPQSLSGVAPSSTSITFIINVRILEINETFLLFSNTTSLTINGLRPVLVDKEYVLHEL